MTPLEKSPATPPPLGVNLSFAVKRWPEPEVWAAFVRRELGVELVQFSFDLLDPWWPEALSRPLARRVRDAAAAEGLELHSAFSGLAAYSYNGLLHPEREGRRAAYGWFERAADLAAEMGAAAVGGPVGGLSVQEAAQPARVKERYDELVTALGTLSEYVGRAGLAEVLLEPTPLVREIPSTVAEAEQFLKDLREVSAVPVRYALDLGHALYRPLYGAEASLEPWLALGSAVALVHLQQTDAQSDSHWGFSQAGVVDVAAVAAQLSRAGVHVPLILEVFYPFERDDDAVRREIVSSVRHCRTALEL